MKHLYFSACNKLKDLDKKDVNLWSGIFPLTGPICLIDRTSYISMPFNFKVYDEFKMPTFDKTFDLSYEDCCDKRALEIIEHSEKLSKPLTIMYSGGIDSTLVLISLMKNLNQNLWRDKLKLALSADSIRENPKFYYEHIRNNFNIISSDNLGSLLDGNSILVGGEHNDQLFGSDIIGKVYRELDGSKLLDNYTRDFMVNWFVYKGVNTEHANRWFDLLDLQIKTKAECEIKSNFHFLWWINFCFKWQKVYFRMLSKLDRNKKDVISADFVKNYFIQFYSSTDFQLWSMQNTEQRQIADWSKYKWQAKQAIYDYNKDCEYRDYKVKIGSLYRLFVQRKSIEAIDENFNLIENYQFNPMDYYNPESSFAN